jgi:hypothetical protein
MTALGKFNLDMTLTSYLKILEMGLATRYRYKARVPAIIQVNYDSIIVVEARWNVLARSLFQLT